MVRPCNCFTMSWPFLHPTAVVEKLYSVINWVKHCLVDECCQILYNDYNPLDRDCYIYREVLSILLVGRASCLNGKIVSMCEGCFFWGRGRVGCGSFMLWKEGNIGVSCRPQCICSNSHIHCSSFFFQELVCPKASGIFDSMNLKLGKLFCFKFIVFVVKNFVMLWLEPFICFLLNLHVKEEWRNRLNENFNFYCC